MEAMKLRHRVWEHRFKFLSDKKKINDKDILQFLENIEARLGVAEYQLQVPGAVLSNEVRNAIKDLDSVFQDKIMRPIRKDIAQYLVKLQSVNTMVSEKPLVVAEEMSVLDNAHKQAILRMLMEPDNGELFVVPIVGMPGTGRTTITQHVYHDRWVCEYFEVRHWVCMSDISEGPSKLLNLVFRHKTSDVNFLEKFHSIVDGKRYLLILDDVTNKDIGVFLQHLLCNVSQGSKVIVTASDMATLGNMEPLQLAKGAPYELLSLSEDEARSLFKSIAFSYRAETADPNQIKLDIGLAVRNKYRSIPRLLMTLAMVLQKRENWDSIRDIMLNSTEDPLRCNLPKVNFVRYYRLAPHIQQCVKYCSLFPKEYEFEAYLLHLWESQEFLSTRETRPEGLNGDGYFEKLLNSRYLFKDNENDSNNNVTVSYKMDSSVKEFPRPECDLVDELVKDIDKASIVHLSFHVIDSKWEAPSWLPDAKQLKSLLFLPCEFSTVGSLPNIDEVLSSLRKLQALDLAAVNCEKWPVSLGELTDLRYLRLGVSSEDLPESITRLTNLQTLDLRHSNVTVLPTSFHKLVGLEHLYTGDRLMDMPPDFGKLTSLQTLDVFIVGENNSVVELTKLEGLVGKLKVRYKKHHGNDQPPKDSNGIFRDSYLTDISLVWSSSYEGTKDKDEFECLQPPLSIKILSFCRWKGVKFPQQLLSMFPFLSRLVSLHIEDCNCKDFPAFSTLPNLKSLQLWDLNNVEYMESSVNNTSPTTDFFPSLEFLMLANLPKIKAWSPEDKHHIFPSLLEFRISGCRKLRSMPQMRRIESLEAHGVNDVLLKHILSSQDSSASSTLKTLLVVSVCELKYLKIRFGLVSLTIKRCSELQRLEIPPLLLEKLKVHECGQLERITISMPYNSCNLKTLEVKRCEKLSFWDLNQDGDHSDESLGAPGSWERLKFLHSVKFVNNFKLETLPIGLSCLESLEELSLHSLHKLRYLPEWIGNIRQLRRLTIQNCPLITTLPESLLRLSKLEKLQIHNCSRLKEIPESIFWTLDVKECPKLQSSRNQQDGQN